MGFSVEFNPEILAVKDHNFTKTQNPEKQPSIKFKTGKPTYSDCITRTGKDKNEIKGDADGLPDERNGRKASYGSYRKHLQGHQKRGKPRRKSKFRTRKLLLKISLRTQKKQEQVSRRAPKITFRQN